MENPGKPSAFSAAAEVAREKGGERKEAIKKTFSSVTDRLSKGVDYVLGAPDAAKYLGKEAADFGKEKVVQGKEAVARAGVRMWERGVAAKDRLVERVSSAKDRLVERIAGVKNTVQGKIVELGKRSAAWGLNTFVVPIEKRLEGVYALPAKVQEWRAGRADAEAAKKETRARLIEGKGAAASATLEERIEALKQELAILQAEYGERVAIAEAARDAANDRAFELRRQAKDRRDTARVKFGGARAAVERLKAA